MLEHSRGQWHHGSFVFLFREHGLDDNSYGTSAFVRSANNYLKRTLRTPLGQLCCSQKSLIFKSDCSPQMVGFSIMQAGHFLWILWKQGVSVPRVDHSPLLMWEALLSPGSPQEKNGNSSVAASVLSIWTLRHGGWEGGSGGRGGAFGCCWSWRRVMTGYSRWPLNFHRGYVLCKGDLREFHAGLFGLTTDGGTVSGFRVAVLEAAQMSQSLSESIHRPSGPHGPQCCPCERCVSLNGSPGMKSSMWLSD